ncbi:MAG: NAD/NADP octopine/nopaline dehydrogenase family protein [Candidatus Eisenbacteria bacterium]|nr:NAD/NADP octopine/nopaline dehydrogenase family protein [Candidatus Eisenbacteria bacterium]
MTNPNDERLHALLRKTRDKELELKYCVVGAGHGGMAMAAHLAIMGYSVNLYNRTSEHLNGVRWHGGIALGGEASGFGRINLATADIAEAISGVDVIMVVTPTTAHRPLAKKMAPHLIDGQIIVLNPGRTGGALEFRKVLDDNKATASVFLAETQTFIYASRALSRSEAFIYRIKNKVPLATLPAYWIPDVLAVINQAFPQFVAGNNVLCTSMENIGAIFHPALTLVNAGWIEATQGNFDYYTQGITPSVAKLLEKIDQERTAVASSLGIGTVSAREWLYLSYDSSGRDLFEAIQNTKSYRGIKAPQNIFHRYVFEDVPMSLVPLASIGAMFGVHTPTIHMIIELASIMHGRDYWSEGRTVEKLGLAGRSVQEIRQMVVGVER